MDIFLFYCVLVLCFQASIAIPVLMYLEEVEGEEDVEETKAVFGWDNQA
jgi:hypothetical protein